MFPELSTAKPFAVPALNAPDTSKAPVTFVVPLPATKVNPFVEVSVLEAPVRATLVSLIVRSENVFAPPNTCVLPKSANVTVPTGKVAFVVPEVVSVKAFAPLVVREELFAKANVPVVAVIERPFIDVAVATPKVGVVKTGEVAKTIFPEPVVLFPSKVNVPLRSGSVHVRVPPKVAAVN
jgi:hypothetical protein